MSEKRGRIRFIVFLFSVLFLHAELINAQQQTELKYVEGELIVRFTPLEDQKLRTNSEKLSVLSSIDGGTISRTSRIVPNLCLIKLPENKTVKDMLQTFNLANGILYAEPNYKLEAFDTTPNDPCYVEQWGLNNIGQTGGVADADIDAPESWDIRRNSDPNIIIAVIDSGVDYNHPDLFDNMWINEPEFNGITGIDDDGNGYVDDIYGYDFCTWENKQRDSDPFDDATDGHGTLVSGVIGAVGNNGEGITGVCWNVKVMAIKLLNYQGNGNVYDAIDSIDYALLMGAKVINASWGWIWYRISQTEINSLREAVELIDEAGVIFVAAVGNNGQWIEPDFSPVYPASYDTENIITVMATDPCDMKPFFSNSGITKVDLAAPGVAILSTMPTYQTQYMYNRNWSTYYEKLGGTSAAAGFVSGACALVWSQWPTLTHYQVKQIILETVDFNEFIGKNFFLTTID